jgi:dolichol-phosphate mannosyltransferase
MKPDITVNAYSRTTGTYDDSVEKDDVTIVVPTLNEALGIGQVIEKIMNEGYYNILVVDGYSSDDTIEVARQYDVKIIHQHGNGKTGAIKTSVDHIKSPYFVVIDGDTTYDPKDIKRFLPHMRYYNQIIGARKKGRENISKLNRFGNWMINRLFNLLFGTNLTDVCSGLYSINTEFAKNLILDTQGFDVEVEIAAQAANSGSITEVPVNYYQRVGLQKLNPLRDGFAIISTIFRLARIFNSVIFYSFLSAFLIVPAAMLLFWVFLEIYRGTWHNGLALIGVMLVLLSTQAFTISTIASQQRRVEQRLMRIIRGQNR